MNSPPRTPDHAAAAGVLEMLFWPLHAHSPSSSVPMPEVQTLWRPAGSTGWGTDPGTLSLSCGVARWIFGLKWYSSYRCCLRSNDVCLFHLSQACLQMEPGAQSCSAWSTSPATPSPKGDSPVRPPTSGRLARLDKEMQSKSSCWGYWGKCLLQVKLTLNQYIC